MDTMFGTGSTRSKSSTGSKHYTSCRTERNLYNKNGELEVPKKQGNERLQLRNDVELTTHYIDDRFDVGISEHNGTPE